MARTTPLRLSTFADRFPAEMQSRVEKLAESLVSATAKELESLIEEPVTTGGLKASRSLEETKKGMRLGWTAPGAIGVDVGRIKSKTYRRTLKGGRKSRPFSRMLGSEKAPEGFTQPAIRKLRLGWEQIVADLEKDF